MGLIFRLLVSVVLVAIVASRLDLGEILQTFEAASLPLFALSLFALLLGQVLTAARWRMLLFGVAGHACRTGYLTELVLVGSFFNFFLPSTVGGDVIRAELLSVRLGSRRHAYLSTLLDRFSALAATLFIGAFASVVVYWVLRWFDWTLIVIAGLFTIPTVAMLMAIRTDLLLDQLRRFDVASRGALGERIASVAETLREYGHDGRLMFRVFLAAIAAQVVGNIGVVALLALALSIEVPAYFHLIAVPIVILVTLLPFSVNGIGIREGAFLLLYGRVGLGAEAAVTLSAAWTMSLVLASLLGGVALAIPGRHQWRRSQLKTARAAAETGNDDSRFHD